MGLVKHRIRSAWRLGQEEWEKRLGELLCLLISRDSCTSEYHTSTNICSEPFSSCFLISPKGEQCKVLIVHPGACDCGASIVLRQLAELQLEPTSSLILSWKINHSYLTTLEALQVSASPGKKQWSLVIWARRKSKTARGLRVIVLRFDTWERKKEKGKKKKVLDFYFERNWCIFLESCKTQYGVACWE